MPACTLYNVSPPPHHHHSRNKWIHAINNVNRTAGGRETDITNCTRSLGMSPILVITQNDVTYIAPSRGMSPILVITQNDVHVGCHRSSWSPRTMLHIAPSRGMSPILVVTQNDVTYRPITWDVTVTYPRVTVTDPRGHPE